MPLTAVISVIPPKSSKNNATTGMNLFIATHEQRRSEGAGHSSHYSVPGYDTGRDASYLTVTAPLGGYRATHPA